jgi:hypothetical protein
LDDPFLDLRLMRECFGDDGRIRLVESVAETAFPTPYRFRCPAGWVAGPESLHRLITLVEREGYGLVEITMPATIPAGRQARPTTSYGRCSGRTRSTAPGWGSP